MHEAKEFLFSAFVLLQEAVDFIEFLGAELSIDYPQQVFDLLDDY
jgi:hypothetical protein